MIYGTLVQLALSIVIYSTLVQLGLSVLIYTGSTGVEHSFLHWFNWG